MICQVALFLLCIFMSYFFYYVINQFIVKEKLSASLIVSQNDTSISAYLEDMTGFDSVASVVYLLDGMKARSMHGVLSIFRVSII